MTRQAPLRLEKASLPELNQKLEILSTHERLDWALQHLPQNFVLSSSFGAQSAVMLHLMTRRLEEIPVVLIDTGYLFPETYQFIDELSDQLDLNVRRFSAELSPAWQEARYGKLWEQGLDGIEQFNRMNKTEPMIRALDDLQASSWFAGIRRQQAASRAEIPVLEFKEGRYKFHPIIDWTDRDIFQYLSRHNLPYHPLWNQGYISIGDVHTTIPFRAGMQIEETRFLGLKRECGLHE